jgi:hypothetical protein
MTLFIFATGGTGSRVIKSLLFMLASGVRLKGVTTVVPIIIDPHKDNHDLQRSVRLLEVYQNIRNGLGNNFQEGDFFYTKIETLRTYSNRDIKDTFVLPLVSDDQQSNRFKDFINYGSLDESNRKFVELLFSESNLDTQMDIGFIGNPNIGSVVLNQIGNSDEFNAFASCFGEKDRIFIISSIFGGTGAAAFPVILKNIRTCQEGNKEFIQNASVGALTVKPYFKVGTPKDAQGSTLIDENTFISKTKAALNYYVKGVNPAVDKLYGIADVSQQAYEYDPGGEKQAKNKAHYIELIGATSIINFMATDTPSQNLRDRKGDYFEYQLKPNSGAALSFQNIPFVTKESIYNPLSKLTLMFRHLVVIDAKGKHDAAWTKGKELIDTYFRGSEFYSKLKEFLEGYEVWLTEMSQNSRSFQPFLTDGDIHHVINKATPKKEFDHDDIDEALSNEADRKTYPNTNIKLMRIFSNGLEQLLADQYKN